MKNYYLFVVILVLFAFANADCIYNAKSVTSYRLINANTVLFESYYNSFIVKTYSYLTSYPSEVYFIKDSFCSYASDVFVWDGEVIDVSEVKKL